MDKKIKIFCCCSHSHEDKPLLDQLRKHLNLLERQETIAVWSDDNVLPGAVSLDEVIWHFNTAQIVLLLISPDFVQSDHCYNIMQQAVKRQEEGAIHVVPILLRLTDLRNSSVAKLQFLPADGRSVIQWEDKDRAFFDVVQKIRRMVENWYQQSPPPHEKSKSANMGNVSHIPQTPTYSPLSTSVKPGKESNIIKNRASTWLFILIIGLVIIGSIWSIRSNGGIDIPQIIHSADNNSRSNTHSPLQLTASTPSSTSGTTSSNSLGNTPSLLRATASTSSSTSGITKISENRKLLCPACSDPTPNVVLDNITIETNNIKTILYFTITNPRTDSCVFGYLSMQLYDPDGNEHYARQGGGGGTTSIAPNNSIKDSEAFNNFIPVKGTQYTLKVAFGRYYASCASSNSQDNIYQNTTLIF